VFREFAFCLSVETGYQGNVFERREPGAASMAARTPARIIRLKRWMLVAALMGGATPSMAVEGLWQGRYICRQGMTGVTLKIVSEPGGTGWSARFCFCAIAENPNLPTGEFELDGPRVPGETVVRLSPRRWIHEPQGWLMIPLALSQSADGRRLSGMIDAPGCGAIQLEKVIDGSAAPRCACHPVPTS
jgi:hypothetical protein